ncbi:MAG TPA: hypothetical protein PKC98_13495 [Candidatus Melainabacteria bacterium]|nr:hypothetical protein [Candidatus Melainabacteria bacterium]
MSEEENKKTPPSLGSTQAKTPDQEARLKAEILRSKLRTVKGLNENFTGEETMGWLVRMDDSAISADETIMPGKLLDASQMTMPVLMDILFDSLERYSFEFNKKNEFTINCLRPDGFQEKIDHFNRRKFRFMKGHLSSDEYSMVFYATDSAVDVYIIPTDFLVGFDPDQSDFPAFLTFKKLSVQDSSSWGIDRTKISLDEFPRVCRRLLGQIIKVTRGEALSTDKFAFSSSSKEEEEAVLDRSFEALDEDEIGLHPGEQLPSAPKPTAAASDGEKPKPLSTLARSTLADMSVPPLATDKEPEPDVSAEPAASEESEVAPRRARKVTEVEVPPASLVMPSPEHLAAAAAAVAAPGPEAVLDPVAELGSKFVSEAVSDAKVESELVQDSNEKPLKKTLLDIEIPASRAEEPVPETPPEPAPSRSVAEKTFFMTPQEVPEKPSGYSDFSDSSHVSIAANSIESGESEDRDNGQDNGERLKNLKDKIRLSDRHRGPIFDQKGEFLAIKEQVDSAQETVVDACCVIVSGIDDALDALQEEGMSAMKGDNVQRVTEVMDESRRLRSIKEKLVAVSKEIADL